MDGSDSAKIAELTNLILFCKENNFNYTATAANNMMAYMLKRNGNLEAGTKAIEKCLTLHPGGYNPIDSRAEFYLYEGDTAQAIETYKKVLEKYPYAQYAKIKLEELIMDL
jgi:Tfp pilus assembly protein PilF